MSRKKVLITGAAGFIGVATVCEFVDRGWDVYALVHRSRHPTLKELESNHRITVLQGDITDSDSMKKVFNSCANPLDAVVHCAGRATDLGWTSAFRKANLDAVEAVGQLGIEYDVARFVFLSTTDVYGMYDFNGEPEEELDYDDQPWNNYPRFKILAEKWIRGNMPADRYTILRPTAVWAKDDPQMTKRVKDFLAWTPVIVHFGRHKGTNRWPRVHVSMVARASYLAASMPEAAGEIYNVVEREKISVDDFYRSIAKIFFPKKNHRTVTVPFWVGYCLGLCVSGISNTMNLSWPVFDPSLYALYTVSCNLDFSGEKYLQLENMARKQELI